MTEWSFLQQNLNRCHLNTQKIDWDVTWMLFNKYKGFKCTSMKHHATWTFLIKLLHKALPLGMTLKQRRPKLYNEFEAS